MDDRIHVLHVDDDPPLLDLSAQFLERVDPDLAVSSETSPNAALDTLTDGTVDCVVSDYEMPEMDGLTFLETVRETRPDLPFILFTGKGSEEVASDAIATGVTDYLRKETGTAQYEVLAHRIRNAVSGYRVERDRQAAVERISTVYERITDAFFALDTDWRFTYLNSQAAASLGQSISDLTGAVIWEAVPEIVDSDFSEQYRRAMDAQESVRFVEFCTTSEAWLEVQAYPSPEGLSVFFRDVTERRRMTRRVRTGEERVETLQAVTVDLLACETDTEVASTIVEAAERILEFDICFVMFRDGDRLVPAAESSTPYEGGIDPVPLDFGVLGESIRTGESLLVDDLEAHPVANPVHAKYRSGLSVPVGDLGVFQAVSEHPGGFSESDRKLAEVLVAHAVEAFTRINSEAELRDERDRIAALFENVPEPAVAYVFRDGKPIVREVNSAFQSTFGFEADDLVGENIDEYIVPVDQEVEAVSLNELLQAGETVEVESRRRTKAGERDFLLQVVPLVIGERNVEGYAIYTDITDQKVRERELERQNDRLAKFAAVVSHDLRNPLTVAQGNLDLLRGACEGCEECDADEHFDAIDTANERMRELTEDVLALARQGQTVGEKQRADLTELIWAAWTTAGATEATIEVADDLGTVRADPGRLQQLLENMFCNATDHAGEDATVRVGPLEDGFYVADDGPGIAADRRDAVFDAGYTEAEDGTGFGLAIVRSVAEAHGWTVDVVESSTGGARFDVRTGAVTGR